jgi:ParB family transcriptional regulator, chromosome partitioning protein
MAKRRSLGRGLEVLLSTPAAPSREQSPAAAPERASEPGLREVPVDLLERGRYQPRVDMREETLAELAESIRAQGVVQPIVVRPKRGGSGGETRYEIVAGERRWRAAQLAGLHSIPAVVREIPDEAAVAVALIENIQREDLNPLEEALALKRLVEEFDMTHAQAADAVGRSRATVTNLLRLLELPEAVREMLARRELDMGHARALLGLEVSAGELRQLAERIVRQGMSVRETEQAVRQLAAGKRGNGKARSSGRDSDPDVVRLETTLGERLGAPVKIEQGRAGGRLVIRYHSLEELEGIVELLDRNAGRL